MVIIGGNRVLLVADDRKRDSLNAELVSDLVYELT